MIDIHSHILPIGDDGSQSMQEALELARLAVKEGVRELVATPHHRNGFWDAEKEDVERLTEQLQKMLDDEGIDLKVHPGQEIRIHDELFSDLKKDRIQFIDSKNTYILLELPFHDLPTNGPEVVKKLNEQGVIPIIAHPERNRKIASDFNELIPYIKAGAVTQLTAGSYLGEYGEEAEKSAKELVERNLIDIVASDAHNTYRRPFYWQEFYDSFTSDYGQEAFKQLKKNASLLLAGDDIRKNRNMLCS